jgi:hypothetical protein
MALASAIAIAHWMLGRFDPWLFAAAQAMAFVVTAMNHNHSHHPVWRARAANRATDLWFTLFQGHPGFVFEPLHVASHHRHHNGVDDPTRTYRFRAGNDLVGLLRHPFEFAWVAAPRIAATLRALARADRRELAWVLGHYALLATVDGLALWLDWRAALYVVLAPQAAALFWLLASNYLQHADADGGSEFDHARNFFGAINALAFNVGYHTAHHREPTRHWSELPQAHAALAARIHPALVEPDFFAYCARVFLLAPFLPRCRSRPLARTPTPDPQHG